MNYLLDTNIISAISKGRNLRLADRIRAVGADECVTSVIVAGELRYGAEKVGNDRFIARTEASLSATNVLHIDDDVTEAYAKVRAAVEKAGKPIGQNDLWIAAHAIALGLTLVTENVSEFSRVPGLRVENWLREDG